MENRTPAIVSTGTPTLYPSDHLHSLAAPTSHFVPQRLFCIGPLMTIFRECQTFATSAHPISRSSNRLYLRLTLCTDDGRCPHQSYIASRLPLSADASPCPFHSICHQLPTSRCAPVPASIPVSRPTILIHVPTLPFPASLLWFSSNIAHPIPSLHQLSLPHHLAHLV